MNLAITKARALEEKILARHEENRKKFPTAALLMEQFKIFAPTVVEANENGHEVRHKNWKPATKFYVWK